MSDTLSFHVTETIQAKDHVVGGKPEPITNACAVRQYTSPTDQMYSFLPHEANPADPRLQIGGLIFTVCKHCAGLFQYNA